MDNRVRSFAGRGCGGRLWSLRLWLDLAGDEVGPAWTYTQAGWINTANALGYFVGSAATLATIRRLGNRDLFVVGVILTTLSLIMTGIGDNIWVLSVWRLLAGVGGAPVFIAGGALAVGSSAAIRR